MRIISGEFGGRTLLPPPTDKTRPITDRAKQSLFDNLVAEGRLEHAGVVLDCFAGTGSMGLECLSRGMARAIFVERDRATVRALKQNIAALGLADRSLVLPIDAYAAALHPDISQISVAFVDPPYAHMETGHLRHKIDRLVQLLAASALRDSGVISLRHPSRVSVDAQAMAVRVVRELRYGDMGITWLEKLPAPARGGTDDPANQNHARGP